MKKDKQQEINNLAYILDAAMDALASTLTSNVEIVRHNLTTPATSVQNIINGHVSGRSKGDGLLSGPDSDMGFAGLLSKHHSSEPLVVKNYKTTAANGKVLNSASTIYYSEDGEPIMAFCINTDEAPYEQIRKGFDALVTNNIKEDGNDVLRLDNLVEQTIQDIIDKHAITSKKIHKTQRLRIVSEMHDKGIFKMKGGVQHAAQALGVTRYTVYNDLEVLGEKN